MAGSESVRLTNQDFRKLLSTPSLHKSASASNPSAPSSVRGVRHNAAQRSRHRPHGAGHGNKSKKDGAEEDDSLTDILKNYRDRAKERRDGKFSADADDPMGTSGYRAVAPAEYGVDPEEKRRRAIAESKYLGGDMEHTHLVKGLDYALLQKMRSELDLEKEAHLQSVAESEVKRDESSGEVQPKMQFHSRMAKNLYEMHFSDDDAATRQRREYYLPGRMVFQFDLDDVRFDGRPTVVLKSKADLQLAEASEAISTSDLVIDKLIEILSYTRHGVRLTKKKKRDKWTSKIADAAAAQRLQHDPERDRLANQSIFDDIDDSDYRPAAAASAYERADDRHRTSGRSTADTSRPRSTYFESSRGGGHHSPEADRRRRDAETMSIIKSASDKYSKLQGSEAGGATSRRPPATTSAAAEVVDSYAECYPGYDEAMDAIADSDDEEDNEKRGGDGKRKNLDAVDMALDETTPKAAHQFGKKLSDNRKTRRSQATERQKVNQEWQRIQGMLEKRKHSGGDGQGPSTADAAKYAKY